MKRYRHDPRYYDCWIALQELIGEAELKDFFLKDRGWKQSTYYSRIGDNQRSAVRPDRKDMEALQRSFKLRRNEGWKRIAGCFGYDLGESFDVQREPDRAVRYYPFLTNLLTANRGAAISPYPGFGWGCNIDLQKCPDAGGWPINQVEWHHDPGARFSMPDEYKADYQRYVEENWEAKRLFNDGRKMMLTRNPTSFEDSRTLQLHSGLCVYSETLFYQNAVATVATRRNALIHDLINGSLEARFANSICMHTCVVTADDKVLMTLRSPKVEFFPRTWSCSIEENAKEDDLQGGVGQSVSTWGKRMLQEELHLEEAAYDLASFRIMAVFLEAEYLGTELCAFVRLRLDSRRLNDILMHFPLTDREFTDWIFFDFTPEAVAEELVRSRRNFCYHPTSQYRLIHAALKEFGQDEVEKALSDWSSHRR